MLNAENPVPGAKIKAAIIAMFEQSPDRKSVKEIADSIRDVMVEVHYNNDSLRKMLETMAGNGQIDIERHDNHVFFAKGKSKFAPKLHVVKDKPIRQTGPNEYLFDIVGTTGKIRITHGGIVEELRMKGPLTFKVGDETIVVSVVKD